MSRNVSQKTTLISLVIICAILYKVFIYTPDVQVFSKLSDVYEQEVVPGKSVLESTENFLRVRSSNDDMILATINCDYETVSVAYYEPNTSKWQDVEITEMGNNQYSIDYSDINTSSNFATYCVTLQNGENVKQYYFVTLTQ